MAAKRKKNVPVKATSRKEEKQVRIPEQQKPERPVWRFHTADLDGPFAWPKGGKEELNIIQRLHQFDSMTWMEILKNGDHHLLSPSSLSEEAKERLLEIQRDDDIEALFSFRMGGKPRFIAIRDRNVANLLWYDPEHGVAPSTLKHT